MEKLNYEVLKKSGYTGYILENAPEKVGEKALRMLLDLIEGKNVEKELYIPYKIVDGDTL